MKYSFLIIALITLFVMVSSTTDTASPKPETSIPTLQIKTNFLSQLDQLQTHLEQLLLDLKDKNIQQARATYLKARIPFKQAEFLIAYLDPQLYERSINESPLLKPTPKVANKETHYPGGFQVIDEQLFEEQVTVEPIQKTVTYLKTEIQRFRTRVTSIRFYDAMIIHAMKEALIRSFTLGITGFDTPASDNAIEDFKQVNQGILNTLLSYKERFSPQLISTIEQQFNAINYDSFDDFDRYAYLVGQLIPILENLEAIRVSANLETKEELNRYQLPLNSSFTNPFQADFLNASYYTNIPNQQIQSAQIELGKQLFNDPILSDNLKTSCATCHNEKLAFTDQLERSMNGDKTQTTSRNSPSLNYSIYASAYFFDLRAHDLKNQFDHVIHNEKEFNSDYTSIIKKLHQNKDYQQKFATSYAQHPNPISTASINHALKSYLMSLPRFDSPFDQLVQTKTETIPEELRQGFNLFMGKAQCATCHFPPTFSGLVPPRYVDSESEVLGVLDDENFDHPKLDKDLGRINNGITKDNYDFFANSFKTVSIRNVALTAPYMHNGSIKTLEKVIEFYDLGGGVGMGLDLPHQTLPEDQLNLTDAEKAALVVFLESLTDSNY
ncbi:cytochrome c peroxidase [Aureispira sp. CCB-E]|uniref:cytochrome c peroxidase n=1 Tax=Aureispira sp. CCB-E TaxID=3051121 RepID=UPI0028690A56|nr:cytochrome c peroxidase [Aureispira sp. CCB-E]WMX12869.1 cytochrome c peroxidase [Aureispira sp. CCB-E]